MRKNKSLILVFLINFIIVNCSDINKNLEPTVTEVIVSSSSNIVLKGGNLQFFAAVLGINNPSQNVNWSIEFTESDTSISSDGLLCSNR